MIKNSMASSDLTITPVKKGCIYIRFPTTVQPAILSDLALQLNTLEEDTPVIVRRFVDMSRVEKNTITYADLQAYLSIRESVKQSRELFAALYVTNEFQMNLARVCKVALEGAHHQVSIFQTPEEACTWLNLNPACLDSIS